VPASQKEEGNLMQKRKLGRLGPEVPPIILGGNVYGWTLNEAESLRQLDRAIDLGLNCIDTADVYSRWAPGHHGGESETIIGNWFRKSGRRKDVILATKVGMDMGDGRKGLTAQYIERAVEDSLRRLQTDYIDLYQAHTDDVITAQEETLSAFEKLVRSGKVRWIGASNYVGARLEMAIKMSREKGWAEYVSIQPHYNLVERASFERDLLPVVRKYEIGVIPYFSLAAGFLTGKYRRGTDTSVPRGGMVKKYMNDQGFAVVDALDDVAARHNATAAQVALAWLLEQPGVTAPIASATSDKHLDDLVAATSLRLTDADQRQLNEVSAGVAA
jgi:aryl-alcohol dehydrogenase-like predicted oxidoreductase